MSRPNKSASYSNFANVKLGEDGVAGDLICNSIDVSGDIATDSLVLADTSGEGIRLGDADTSSFGWRDITSSIEVRGVAATDPSWEQVDATGFYAYNFGVGDKVWMTYHIPHDIVPNADIHLHAHWFPDGTNANPVKWQFTYAYAKGFNQQAFPLGSPTVVTVEQASPEVQYQHMVAETVAQTVAGLSEPDGMIHVIIERITNGATENTDGIFMLTSDIHYQSTNMTTINKAPNFYGT